MQILKDILYDIEAIFLGLLFLIFVIPVLIFLGITYLIWCIYEFIKFIFIH